MHKGSCLCGAISFEVACDLPPPDGCHCSLCRKHSGHYFASTDVPRTALTIMGEQNIAWYRSSEKVRRGFCRVCGSSLFGGTWPEGPEVSVRLGSLDGDPGIRPQYRSFVASKAVWDEIPDDGLERYDGPPPRP